MLVDSECIVIPLPLLVSGHWTQPLGTDSSDNALGSGLFAFYLLVQSLALGPTTKARTFHGSGYRSLLLQEKATRFLKTFYWLSPMDRIMNPSLSLMVAQRKRILHCTVASGTYNASAKDWETGDLIIGMWQRFRAPHAPSSDIKHLRCRQYPGQLSFGPMALILILAGPLKPVNRA